MEVRLDWFGSGIWNMLSNNLNVSDYNMYMYLSMISYYSNKLPYMTNGLNFFHMN